MSRCIWQLNKNYNNGLIKQVARCPRQNCRKSDWSVMATNSGAASVIQLSLLENDLFWQCTLVHHTQWTSFFLSASYFYLLLMLMCSKPHQTDYILWHNGALIERSIARKKRLYCNAINHSELTAYQRRVSMFVTAIWVLAIHTFKSLSAIELE